MNATNDLPVPALDGHSALDFVRELHRRGVPGVSLAEFATAAWHVLEPATPLVWNWHLDAVCSHLQALLTGGPGSPSNLLINVPPGSMKSLLTAVFAPAWLWLFRPSWRMVFASGTPSVVSRDSLKTRELIKAAWYQDTFKPEWTISKTQDEKQLFSNTKGGFRQGVGAGGSVTGVRAEWLCVDDPNDAKEVHGKAHRDNINERWWSNAFHNRVADPSTSKRTLIMQRLHELDLAGYVLEREAGEWEHLCIRMEHEVDNPLKPTWLGWTDPRTKEGELMFPSRFTPEYCASERKALGPTDYDGQMQQRPSAQAGNRFKREYWRFYTPAGGPAGQRPRGCNDLPSVALPTKFDRVTGSWDLSFKGTDTSDYVAGILVGSVGTNRYIRSVFNERTGILGALDAIKKQWRDWAPSEILVEDKANGPAVIETLSGQVPRIIPVDPRGGKESRAAAVEPIIAAGNVYLPEGADWVPAFIEQFAAFPKGRNDDMVDTTSQALTHLEENSDVRRARALLGMVR